MFIENIFSLPQSLQQPYIMAGINAVVADTDEAAQYLATSLYAFFLNVVRGTSFPLAAPLQNIDGLWNDMEKAAVLQMLQYNFVGSKETVGTQLETFVNRTGVDEIMVVSNIFDHQARVRSYELLSQLKVNAVAEQEAVFL